MTRMTLPLVLAGMVGWTPAAVAAPQYAYPAKGQNMETQKKDESECSKWASEKTGFDPTRHTPRPSVQPEPVTGSGARVAGAATGAAVAGISGGKAAEGAAAGAVAGGLIRRSRNQNAAAAEQKAIDAERAAAVANFDKARGACLTGRGYTVR